MPTEICFCGSSVGLSGILAPGTSRLCSQGCGPIITTQPRANGLPGHRLIISEFPMIPRCHWRANVTVTVTAAICWQCCCWQLGAYAPDEMDGGTNAGTLPRAAAPAPSLNLCDRHCAAAKQPRRHLDGRSVPAPNACSVPGRSARRSYLWRSTRVLRFATWPSVSNNSQLPCE
jgi:hypothetical protein